MMRALGSAIQSAWYAFVFLALTAIVVPTLVYCTVMVAYVAIIVGAFIVPERRDALLQKEEPPWILMTSLTNIITDFDFMY